MSITLGSNLLGLPRLTDNNHKVTSPPTRRYNCIAWAAGDISNWWCPHLYWPPGVPREKSVKALRSAFASAGYQRCADGSLEPAKQKIAIYAVRQDSEYFPKHAAIQLDDGRWSSKLGENVDIRHDTPEDVECAAYGRVIEYMVRPRSTIPRPLRQLVQSVMRGPFNFLK